MIIVEDGSLKLFNITETCSLYDNSKSICKCLSDDLKHIDKRITYIDPFELAKYFCRFVENPYEYDAMTIDKRIKEWIIRKYKSVEKSNNRTNRELNKMIRENYQFVMYFEQTNFKLVGLMML